MHLKVTKDNKCSNREKKKLSEKNIFLSKSFLFSPNIMSFATQMEAGRKLMPWLHLE